MGLKIKVGQELVVTAQDLNEQPISSFTAINWSGSDPQGISVVAIPDSPSATVKASKPGANYSVSVYADMDTPKGKVKFNGTLPFEAFEGDFAAEGLDHGLVVSDQDGTAAVNLVVKPVDEPIKQDDRNLYGRFDHSRKTDLDQAVDQPRRDRNSKFVRDEHKYNKSKWGR